MNKWRSTVGRYLEKIKPKSVKSLNNSYISDLKVEFNSEVWHYSDRTRHFSMFSGNFLRHFIDQSYSSTSMFSWRIFQHEENRSVRFDVEQGIGFRTRPNEEERRDFNLRNFVLTAWTRWRTVNNNDKKNEDEFLKTNHRADEEKTEWQGKHSIR